MGFADGLLKGAQTGYRWVQAYKQGQEWQKESDFNEAIDSAKNTFTDTKLGYDNDKTMSASERASRIDAAMQTRDEAIQTAYLRRYGGLEEYGKSVDALEKAENAKVSKKLRELRIENFNNAKQQFTNMDSSKAFALVENVKKGDPEALKQLQAFGKYNNLAMSVKDGVIGYTSPDTNEWTPVNDVAALYAVDKGLSFMHSMDEQLTRAAYLDALLTGDTKDYVAMSKAPLDRAHIQQQINASKASEQHSIAQTERTRQMTKHEAEEHPIKLGHLQDQRDLTKSQLRVQKETEQYQIDAAKANAGIKQADAQVKAGTTESSIGAINAGNNVIIQTADDKIKQSSADARTADAKATLAEETLPGAISATNANNNVAVQTADAKVKTARAGAKEAEANATVAQQTVGDRIVAAKETAKQKAIDTEIAARTMEDQIESKKLANEKTKAEIAAQREAVQASIEKRTGNTTKFDQTNERFIEVDKNTGKPTGNVYDVKGNTIDGSLNTDENKIVQERVAEAAAKGINALYDRLKKIKGLYSGYKIVPAKGKDGGHPQFDKETQQWGSYFTITLPDPDAEGGMRQENVWVPTNEMNKFIEGAVKLAQRYVDYAFGGQ